MIEVREISKAYPTVKGVNQVLDRVSVHFKAGENVGILGRNGQGKSTFLRLLAGVESPDEGEISWHCKVSWPLGFSGGFNAGLSGEENCRFIARIYGEDPDRIVDFAYEFAEIGKYFFMPMRTYSSGMRARMSFAISMALDFDLYLIDEITAVGDGPFREKCEAEFESRHNRTNMIMVSHATKTIRTYCNKAAILSDGQLRFFDDLDEAISTYDKRLK